MLYIIDLALDNSEALVEIVADGDEEFGGDLAALKSIPTAERDYDPDTEQWTLLNPDDHAGKIPRLYKALQGYRRQPRLF